jgi:hypothetical protein
MRRYLTPLAIVLAACAGDPPPSDQTGAASSPGQCANGVQDHDETDVDCGGSVCTACANGKRCASASDCQSLRCDATHVCVRPTSPCADGVKDGNETDVDCGGDTCPPCVNFKGCGTNSDCQSGYCDFYDGRCYSIGPTCANGFRDGTETDYDCGGGACPPCDIDYRCHVASDCISDYCTPAGWCELPPLLCKDGIKDGDESDVDCGGPTCERCAEGKACRVGSDCRSSDCVSRVCTPVPATCVDGLLDGDETDVDCGGSCPWLCGIHEMCKVDADCQTGHCDPSSHTCAASPCTDGIQDAGETDVDCGGTCAPCALAQGCLVDADCQSLACDGVSLTCVPDLCNDHRQDGAETDVDCGGYDTCARCAVGAKCENFDDCEQGHTCDANPPHVCL